MKSAGVRDRDQMFWEETNMFRYTPKNHIHLFDAHVLFIKHIVVFIKTPSWSLILSPQLPNVNNFLPAVWKWQGVSQINKNFFGHKQVCALSMCYSETV